MRHESNEWSRNQSFPYLMGNEITCRMHSIGEYKLQLQECMHGLQPEFPPLDLCYARQDGLLDLDALRMYQEPPFIDEKPFPSWRNLCLLTSQSIGMRLHACMVSGRKSQPCKSGTLLAMPMQHPLHLLFIYVWVPSSS